MKNLTGTKKILIGVVAFVVAFTAIGAGTYSYAKSNAQKTAIGIDKAISIAMLDAGASEADTVVTKAKIEFNDGVFAYDIEFNVATVNEYEYSIKADDGTILERSRDVEDYVDEVVVTEAQTTQDASTTTQAQTQQVTTQETTTSASQETTTKAATTEKTTKKTTTTKSSTQSTTKNTTTKKSSDTTTSSGNITASKAKSIALNDAGVKKSNAQNLNAHKDYDDGVAYYEVEFNTDSYEYEYEIDMNGNIISFDKEPYHTKRTTTTTTTTASADYIGVAAAKKVALKDAGLSSGDVTFIKAKFEVDDGVPLYDIEFETSQKEYEYEINALTGDILDKSVERLDYDD